MGDPLSFDAERLRILIERHLLYTGSARARNILDKWDVALARFVKVLPADYAKALAELKREKASLRAGGGGIDMANPTGFLTVERHDRASEKPAERTHNYREFVKPMAYPEVAKQASRCMDCGIPYCHNGCPVNNQIPDWNNLVYRDQWRAALDNLHSTNNFPEFTGRVCPAPCEASCTLNIDDNRSRSKPSNARSSIAAGRKAGSSRNLPSERPARTSPWWARDRRGSPAPSNLRAPATASPCSRRTTASAGCCATAIPDFKMEKHPIDRRLRQMEAEGVSFRPGVEVGAGMSVAMLLQDYDAVVMAGGAELPRDLDIEGRALDGITSRWIS